MPYRALIVAAVQLAIGLLTAFGVVLPEGLEQVIIDNAVAIVGGAIALWGVVGLIRGQLAARKSPPPENPA